MSDANLARQRAWQALEVRRLRINAACAALRTCELNITADALFVDPESMIDRARLAASERRRVNSDGRDDAMYAATGAALEALGRLWAAL